jgi:hypothetical protein
MFASGKTSAASTGGYQISRSLRFNSADSAYLNRTPASATNQKTWTWSGWVKRSTLRAGLTDPATIFNAGGNGFLARFSYANQDQLEFYNYSGAAYQLEVITTQVFRDVSAWYHIVFVLDTTQATSSNRFKVYVNGSQITAFSTATYPSQNADLLVNNTSVHALGVLNGIGGYYSGYMTEVNFIDGQALTPSSFGETNAQTGVWQPKAYSGSYGTNGFYLNFSDNSNTTAATLGKDYSGNGNNWTPNNFSVSAGAGNDSLVDSPTSYGTDTGAGGTVRGNYSTLSPTYAGATGISNGNLDVTLAGGTQYGSMSLTTGKWYWEVTATASLSGSYLGVMDSTFIKTDATWGTTTTSVYVNNGDKYGIGGTGAYGASYTTGDVIGFALDLDAGTMVFYKNGASQGTASSGMTGREWRPMLYASGGTYACNFGQRPFAYTAPSGFKALCTQNLPTPTIGATTATQAGKYFNTVTYTGNGTGQSITGVGFQPDWVWVKGRSGATDHALYDAVRGVQKQLETNNTDAETTEITGLTAFGSDGFTTGVLAQLNTITATYVAWNWKANGSGSTNTAGSITSTVSVSTTSGFSVVTYTGTGANATVGHGLGVVPSMLIQKNRISGTALWFVYHRTLGATKFLRLNADNAEATNSGVWNDTAPTSTVISIGSNSDINGSSQGGVFYCFAEVAGYSAFGSYTGNGSADGPFVFTNMRPAYIMIKRTNDSGNWQIFDDTRSPINVINNVLFANSSSAEISDSNRILDFVSNGFKLRVGAPATNDINASGSTYIFAAFAENPFKYSLAR